MKLSFSSQFTLAPLITVAILAGLVIYTLFEIANIKYEHKKLRDSELNSDTVQTSISSINHIHEMIIQFSEITDFKEHDLFFNYLEQNSILKDNLNSVLLNESIPHELSQLIIKTKKLIEQPVDVDPNQLKQTLDKLLEKLKYQFKILSAKRRSIFIDNHTQLKIISTRITLILLSGLIICIVSAIGLTHWGLVISRKRLKSLSLRAYEACVKETNPHIRNNNDRDELDELENYITEMTSKLIKTASIKNVLRGAENERRRIAMDIHDSILTDLTTLNRILDTKNKVLELEKINILRTDINNIILNLRRTIDDLHPQVLETLGLEPALRSLIDRLNKIPGSPAYHFEFFPDIENLLSNEVKLNIFRIINEVINNIIKHARCDRFEIIARIVSNKILVTIEDNGIGMNNNYDNVGYGCANILERANLINATVKWNHSRFSTGTSFELKLDTNKNTILTIES